MTAGTSLPNMCDTFLAAVHVITPFANGKSKDETGVQVHPLSEPAPFGLRRETVLDEHLHAVGRCGSRVST
jgi:hypothetical protein